MTKQSKDIVRAFEVIIVRDWHGLLPYALWVDTITYNSVIDFMPTELMNGQKAGNAHKRDKITSWLAMLWENDAMMWASFIIFHFLMESGDRQHSMQKDALLHDYKIRGRGLIWGWYF